MTNPLFQRLVEKAKSLEDIEFLENYEAISSEEQSQMESNNVLWNTMKNFGIVVIIAVLVMLLLNAYGVDASGMSAEIDPAIISETLPPRFLVEGYHEYLWRRYEQLPYVVIEEMCWNEVEGYGCDPRLAEDGDVINTVTDFELRLRGHVYQNEAGCWLWWWQYSHDEQNNPHPLLGVWVECPPMVVLEF